MYIFLGDNRIFKTQDVPFVPVKKDITILKGKI